MYTLFALRIQRNATQPPPNLENHPQTLPVIFLFPKGRGKKSTHSLFFIAFIFVYALGASIFTTAAVHSRTASIITAATATATTRATWKNHAAPTRAYAEAAPKGRMPAYSQCKPNWRRSLPIACLNFLSVASCCFLAATSTSSASSMLISGVLPMAGEGLPPSSSSSSQFS